LLRAALRVPCPEFIAGLSFLDRERGFLACGSVPATIDQLKELYVTDDSGSTWRIRERSKFQRSRTLGGSIPIEGHADGIEFRSATDGFLLAGRVGLYRTRDGGHHWDTPLFGEDAEFVTGINCSRTRPASHRGRSSSSRPGGVWAPAPRASPATRAPCSQPQTVAEPGPCGAAFATARSSNSFSPARTSGRSQHRYGRAGLPARRACIARATAAVSGVPC
jgi:hypothetical protein